MNIVTVNECTWDFELSEWVGHSEVDIPADLILMMEDANLSGQSLRGGLEPRTLIHLRQPIHGESSVYVGQSRANIKAMADGTDDHGYAEAMMEQGRANAAAGRDGFGHFINQTTKPLPLWKSALQWFWEKV